MSEPDLDARIRASFAAQGLMSTLGATIERVAPGEVDIALVPTPAVSQQHGFVHGGAVAAIADAAAGYAAYTVMPPDAAVLTVEFKINFVAPATGDRLQARGRVVKAGRTLVLCQTNVFAETGGREKLVAVLTATMMNVPGERGLAG